MVHQEFADVSEDFLETYFLLVVEQDMEEVLLGVGSIRKLFLDCGEVIDGMIEFDGSMGVFGSWWLRPLLQWGRGVVDAAAAPEPSPCLCLRGGGYWTRM